MFFLVINLSTIWQGFERFIPFKERQGFVRKANGPNSRGGHIGHTIDFVPRASS